MRHCFFYVGLMAFTAYTTALSVSEAIETSLQQSPYWQQQTALFQSQELNPSIAANALLPSVTATAQQQSGAIYNYKDLSGTTVDPSAYSQTQIQVQLNIPLYRPGVYWTYQASCHQASADSFSYNYQKEQFMTQVLQQYFNVLLQQKNVTLSQRFLDSRAKLYEDTQDKFDVGLVALSDLKAAQAYRDQAVARQIQAHFDLTTAQEQLINLIGMTPKNLYDAPLNIEVAYPEYFTPQKTHYSLLITQKLSDKSEDSVKAANASFYPEVMATSSYTKQPVSQSGGPKSISQMSAGLTVSWTPIQAALTPAIQQARYAQQAAKAAQMQSVRDYNTNTVLAQQSLKTAIAQLAAERESLVSNRIYLATIEASFDAGQSTITDVLDAQEAVTQQEMRVYQQIYNCLTQFFKLGLLMSYPYDELLHSIDSFLKNESTWFSDKQL